jgi:hypothetical protein
MSTATQNGSPSSHRNGSAAARDPFQKEPQPLVDGASVGISQHLIQQAEAANQVELPELVPIDEEIRPVADDLSDTDLNQQVASTLSPLPVIASALLVARMVQRACQARREEISRLHGRLLSYQASLPQEAPASKSASHQRGWLKEAALFWFNWAGVAVAGLSAWLGVTIATEVMYQIGGLREGSWGMVQSFFGAFGFSWGFTMAVVVATFWRRKTLSNPDAHPLDRRMSAVAFLVAWWGLAGFGLMMGLMHSFEEGEGWLLSVLRCALTTASVISLGMICVAIEKGVEYAFRRAYKGTLVRNGQIDEMDAEIHPVATQLMTLAQIEDLASGVQQRIAQHIDSQQTRWRRRRDAIRRENQRVRDIAAEEQKVTLSQQRLAGLRIADAA